MTSGMGVSWGQRRALGTRYSTDPAYDLEQARMDLEYAGLPAKRALAEQIRQYNISQANQLSENEKNRKSSGTSGMVGAAGTVAGMYMLSDSHALGNLVGRGISAGKQMLYPSQVATQAEMGNVAPEVAQGIPETGVSSAVPTGMTATETSGAAGMGVGGFATAGLGVVGGGMVGGQLGASGEGKRVGKFLMANHGSQQDNRVVGGVVGGAIGGAITGAALTSWSGPGAIVGAVVGGIVGAVVALVDSHICTATAKNAYMNPDEIEKMERLKIYALDKHHGWMKSYLNNGPELISAISKQENDLVEFYKNMRLILIEPVCSLIETDIEKAYMVYLAITKMLFKAYMPDFIYKEEE